MYVRLLAPLVVSLVVASTASAQWLDFTEETDTRLVLSTIPIGDDEEKDMAAADLDKDGWVDVVVVRKAIFSNPGARQDVLLMNINGVLTDQTTQLARALSLSSPTLAMYSSPMSTATRGPT